MGYGGFFFLLFPFFYFLFCFDSFFFFLFVFAIGFGAFFSVFFFLMGISRFVFFAHWFLVLFWYFFECALYVFSRLASLTYPLRPGVCVFWVAFFRGGFCFGGSAVGSAVLGCISSLLRLLRSCSVFVSCLWCVCIARWIMSSGLHVFLHRLSSVFFFSFLALLYMVVLPRLFPAFSVLVFLSYDGSFPGLPR